VAARRGIGVGGRSGERPVSDIGILNDPISLIAIALLLGSPGLLLGAIPGALLWRRHRIAGAVVGAVLGFILWLIGWMMIKDVT
jgi:Na+/proline symporter